MIKSGYVQLYIRGEQTVACIIPPKEGGPKVDLQTVRNYLDGFKLTEYKLTDLNLLVELADADRELVVGPKPFQYYNNVLIITMQNDRMKVFGKFFPPSEGGDKIDQAEIKRDLVAHKVICGIKEEVLNQQISNPDYCTDILLAEGTLPRQGENSSIIYKFNTTLNTKPKANEDGTVDYHDLNMICSVSKGQLLAQLIPADLGDPGQDVTGNVLKPRNVRNGKLEYGKNIELSEDRLEIRSMVDGHASLIEGKVFVSDVYEVVGDVDNSTGDINYNGNVEIKGNVRSGFSVFASGDIIVHGVVEGAKLQATGQIIIKRGIHGMGKAVLESGSNVISKFIENAKVYAKNYVSADSILHSEVSAYMNIAVAGKKGFVAGGKICAGKLLEVSNLGTVMGTDTIIEVGVNPGLKNQYESIQTKVKGLHSEMGKIQPVIENFTNKLREGVAMPKKNVGYIQQLAVAYKEMKEQYNDLTKEMETIKEELQMSQDGEVKVTGKVFPGVHINIADAGFNVADERSYCRFVLEHGDIVVKNL